MRSWTIALATAGLAAFVPGSVAAAPPHRSQASDTDRALLEEVKRLREQLTRMQAAQTALQVQMGALQARVDHQAPAAVGTVETAAARTVPAISTAAASTVQTQVTAAVPATPARIVSQTAATTDHAHSTDRFYFQGISIKPGGYVELAGVYRDHFQGNDIASSFSIPFPNNRASHVHEARFSARQSRLSFLAQGDVNATTQLAMYGEFDFLGAAQTANSVQSNSYNPRIRNLYGTADWRGDGYGLHFLAGQNWSLVTLNSRGILPRTEVPPPVIESQNTPGFYWARQPGVRLTADFLDKRLWIAVSAENPQTTFAGAVPPNATYTQTAGLGYDTVNQLSLNHVPDVIGKVAFDTRIGDHVVHVETFGMMRWIDERANGANHATTTFGYGGGIVAEIVPRRLDFQLSGIGGRGIGRYGSAGLPDATFSGDGRLHPNSEIMVLAQATLHATGAIDLYGIAGEEREARNDFPVIGGVAYGLGNPLADNNGCRVEGGTCLGNTRSIRQITFGLWDRIYRGAFGRALMGVQYSLTERQLFDGIGGAPRASNTMGFVSFRYYPFDAPAAK